MRQSLVITFATIRLQGPRLKPRLGQKFETRFMLYSQISSASGTTTLGTAVPEPIPSLENHQKRGKKRRGRGGEKEKREKKKKKKKNKGGGGEKKKKNPGSRKGEGKGDGH